MTTSPRDSAAARPPDDLYATKFISSWLGAARPGDRFTDDIQRRPAAWAHWAASQMTQVDTGERTYPAIWLDGLFYDPHGTGPKLRPHLEIPKRVLNRPDDLFPRRLAHAGNGLAFEWWVYPEVTALRRCLLNGAAGDPSDVFDLFDTQRDGLQEGLEQLNTMIAPAFRDVALLLQTAEDGLAGEATGDFSTEEIATYFPAAAHLKLEVSYDQKLRERSGARASRRVGIWQVSGQGPQGTFAFGVVTPRLTQRSTLTDALFVPSTEAPAALLVRGLVLRRLLAERLDTEAASNIVVGEPASPVPAPQEPASRGPAAHLRAVPARPNQRLPSASADAAVRFLATYSDENAAWEQLRSWASPTYALTVAEGGFKAAHRSALRAVERAEEPHRDDIDVILPLGWADGKLVRVTFAGPTSDD